jgi:predicted AlkP superfamily phosphohydrolase/phosphomutase
MTGVTRESVAAGKRGKRRVLLLGLDAGDKDLLLEGIDDGRLPNLARLREQAAWGVAQSPPGFGSGAIWPSMYTGVSPARHGRYFYRQVWRDRYEARHFDGSDFRARTIWDLLSDGGMRCAVIDVPKAALSEGINGLHVVDWMVHGPVYKQLRCAPETLVKEIEDRFGADPLPKCDQPGGRGPEAQKTFLEIQHQRIQSREDGARFYLSQEDWDFFMLVYAEPHCIGHQSWHVRDPDHPAHDPAALALVGDPVMSVYEAIDASIGRILEDVDDDTTVIVLSVTGMAANYTGNLLLDEVLRRLEGKTKTRPLDWLGRLKGQAKRVLPHAIRKRYRQTSRRVEERVSSADRRRRSCFVVPHNDIAGAIRINLKGREAEGVVEVHELDAFVDSLRRDLLELVNLDTGEPAVKDVVRTSDFCSGDALPDLPDLFVIWRRTAPIWRVGSPKIEEVEKAHRGNRTGDHVSESLFMARGPGIPTGRVEDVSIMDFAPTIARLCGLGPIDSDGRPIEALTGKP